MDQRSPWNRLLREVVVTIPEDVSGVCGTWHWVTWFAFRHGSGSAAWMIGVDDIKGLFQL